MMTKEQYRKMFQNVKELNIINVKELCSRADVCYTDFSLWVRDKPRKDGKRVGISDEKLERLRQEVIALSKELKMLVKGK